MRGTLVQRVQAFYRTFSRAHAFPHSGRRKRELHLAPVERSIGVSSRDVARPAMVGVRAAHRGAWAVRRFSLDRVFIAVAVLPTFVVMLYIFGIPLLFSLYLSFTGWALDQALLGGRFVGLANYEDLLTDPVFVGSLGITFGYTAATVAA